MGISTTAPGKLMLLGEHAVVYGQPCLVTAVESRLEVTINSSDSNTYSIDAPQVKDTRFVDTCVELFSKRFEIKIKGIEIITKSPFSGKFGFGSSSAVTVATLSALAHYYDIPLEGKELFNLAYQVVMKVQGKGSGFDVAAASVGGTLLYTKGGNVFEPLPDHWDEVSLVVGYSGVKSNTVDLIEEVKKVRDAERNWFDEQMEKIGEIVLQAKEAYVQKRWKILGKLMDNDQDILRSIGVSTTKLEALIRSSKHAGAWGAKLSGAGGGDCMVALVSKKKKKDVERAIIAAGGDVLSVAIHTKGVTLEKKRTSKNQTSFTPAIIQA